MNSVIPLVSALAALAVSFFFDRALDTLRLYAAQTFEFAPWRWGGLVIVLIFAAILLSTAWLVGFRKTTPRWAALLAAILGFSIFLGLPIAASVYINSRSLLEPPSASAELLLSEASPPPSSRSRRESSCWSASMVSFAEGMHKIAPRMTPGR